MEVSMLMVLLLLTDPTPDAVPAGLTAPKQRQLDFILSGFEHSRQKLRSGIYRASGRKRDGIEGDARFPAYAGDIEIYSAFDYDRNLFRFERNEPSLFEDAPDQPIRHVALQTKYIRTPELSLHRETGWIERGPSTLAIKAADAKPSDYVFPIDVRNLGAASWYHIRNRTPFDEVSTALRRRRVTEIVEERDGLFRVTQVYNDSGIPKCVYWFDTRQGFSPIRFEFREVDGQGAWLEKPSTLMQVDWTQINDVWVPKTFSIVDQQGGARRLEGYNLRFEWESVNGPVSEDLFTRESLELPRGTAIIDRRLGKPVVIERVGTEARVGGDGLAGALPGLSNVPDAKNGGNSSVRYRTWLILANIAIFAGIAACMVVMRIRRRPNGSAE